MSSVMRSCLLLAATLYLVVAAEGTSKTKRDEQAVLQSNEQEDVEEQPEEVYEEVSQSSTLYPCKKLAPLRPPVELHWVINNCCTMSKYLLKDFCRFGRISLKLIPRFYYRPRSRIRVLRLAFLSLAASSPPTEVVKSSNASYSIER